MPSATQLIQQDHRTVEQMFSRFEADPAHDLAMQICKELEVHTQAEEQAVYPDLKRVDQQMFDEAEHEHDEVDRLIRQVKSAGSYDVSRITPLMRQIKQKVEHHVEEEETQVLPRMEQSCGAERMQQLGDAFAQAKLQQPTMSGFTAGGFGTTNVSSSRDSSSGRSKEQLLDLTKDELYEKAKKADIPGRSSMNKAELAEELAKR